MASETYKRNSSYGAKAKMHVSGLAHPRLSWAYLVKTPELRMNNIS